MTRPRPLRPHRPARAVVVVCVLAVLVLGTLHAYRAARPCGVGVGDPQDAVSGVLRAIEAQDERSLCQRVGAGYAIPTAQEQALRQLVEAAGGPAPSGSRTRRSSSWGLSTCCR